MAGRIFTAYFVRHLSDQVCAFVFLFLSRITRCTVLRLLIFALVALHLFRMGRAVAPETHGSFVTHNGATTAPQYIHRPLCKICKCAPSVPNAHLSRFAPSESSRCTVGGQIPGDSKMLLR